jgi:hypothetical protein
MKEYCISYISKSGVTMLNVIIKSDSRINAIEEIIEDAHLVLSCVTIS